MYICLEGYTVPQYAEANISVFPLFILVFVWLGEWQQDKMKEYQVMEDFHLVQMNHLISRCSYDEHSFLLTKT